EAKLNIFDRNHPIAIRSEQKLHAVQSDFDDSASPIPVDFVHPRVLTSSRRTMGHTPPALRRRLAMESRAKLLGHSVHQMLIVFPLGLLATAVIFDIISLITGRPAWTDASYHMIPAG